jgi:tRNA(fMet)-specific endonuclease VapC
VTYLLDTNIVSYILKRNLTVDNKLREANIRGEEVFISCIMYYEVKRGLLAVNATRQLVEFNQFIRKY